MTPTGAYRYDPVYVRHYWYTDEHGRLFVGGVALIGNEVVTWMEPNLKTQPQREGGGQ